MSESVARIWGAVDTMPNPAPLTKESNTCREMFIGIAGVALGIPVGTLLDWIVGR